MNQPSSPSLDVVARFVRDERMHRLDAYDALNSRAGTVAAVAVALIALALRGWPPLVITGSILAATAASISIRAYSPQAPEQFAPSAVSERYLEMEARETTYELLHEEQRLIEQLYERNECTAREIDRAMDRLKWAGGLLIVGLLVEPTLDMLTWVYDVAVSIG